MKLFKENSYDIVRLYINQIGITIFSFFLFSAVGGIGEDNESLSMTLDLAVSAFSFIFYIILVHYLVWEIGAKDKLRVDSGKYSFPLLKGARIALYANVPNFLLAIVSIIFLSLKMIFNLEWAYSVFGICFLLLKLHGSMFLGFVGAIAPGESSLVSDNMLECIVYLLLPIVTVAFAQFSYFLGSKDKRILWFITNNKKPE